MLPSKQELLNVVLSDPELIKTVLERIPDILIEERKKKQITQKELARRANTHWNHLQKVENTKYQSVSLRTLKNYHKALYPEVY